MSALELGFSKTFTRKDALKDIAGFLPSILSEFMLNFISMYIFFHLFCDRSKFEP